MLKPLALRLQPGQDLKVELDTLVQIRNIEAACIITRAGFDQQKNSRGGSRLDAIYQER
ncbi:DNA-binding protein [Desulforhopalus singaporensis]|uniref:Uncharacterized protein n=1 Tax=Desulforhopalus singaporensis TaxID=91360 RepID=A0A1H0R3W1_9BACT|nr:DNA-binding protein [Desulforhopalus singaporensis]SDP23658.1 hypothetical protein SAMN05660330_02184 [Desulforhopalus singaporensis]